MDFTVDTQNLHPATLLALTALQDLSAELSPETIQDLGCGNGILAIVAATIWPGAQITAIDISEQAVSDARAAVGSHGLANRVFVEHKDVQGYLKALTGQSRAGFDLTICNLLADIIIPASFLLKKCVNNNGYLILSGILAWKAAALEAALISLNIEIYRKYEDSPWVCYVACHKVETIAKPIVTKP